MNWQRRVREQQSYQVGDYDYAWSSIRLNYEDLLCIVALYRDDMTSDQYRIILHLIHG